MKTFENENIFVRYSDKGSVQYEELQGLRIKIGDEEVQASL